MLELDDEVKEELEEIFSKHIETYVTEVDSYDDLEEFSYKISLKDGGFTQEDCVTQQFFNENLLFVEKTNKEALCLLAGGAPFPDDYFEEYNNRINRHLAFYKGLYDLEKPLLVLDDGNEEAAVYKFDSEDEFITICKRSLSNEFSDPIVTHEEQEELEGIEQMLMDKTVNTHANLFFIEHGFMYTGSLEQTNTLIFLSDSKLKENIEFITELAKNSDLYAWRS